MVPGHTKLEMEPLLILATRSENWTVVKPNVKQLVPGHTKPKVSTWKIHHRKSNLWFRSRSHDCKIRHSSATTFKIGCKPEILERLKLGLNRDDCKIFGGMIARLKSLERDWNFWSSANYFPFILDPDPILTRVFLSSDPEKRFAQFRRILLGDAPDCPSQMMLF
jgi:hypothetical protein